MSNTALEGRNGDDFREVVSPKAQVGLGVGTSRACKSAITFVWTPSTAYMGGVVPSVSGLSD